MTSGGTLALVKIASAAKVLEEDYPLDGFEWLLVELGEASPLWIGGAYIPGASDIKFRELQGAGKTDQFQSLNVQLSRRSLQPWVLGGDFNC
eukprot:1283705-Karenia_brevis.AAC.1